MEQLTDQSQEQNQTDTPPLAFWRKPFSWWKKDKTAKPKEVKPKLTLKEKFKALTVSQWFYLLAFITLIATFGEDGQLADVAPIAVVFAGIGLSRELWHLFHAIWSKTLGKGVLLVLYAGTANIVIAISALKINIIAGIEPSPFIFTLGFTTLLLLPLWLTVATVMFFVIAMVIGNVWLICSAFLRVVGIKVPVHWEDKSFVAITMILRIILIAVLVAGLVNFIQPYAEQLDVFERPVAIFDNEMSRDQQIQMSQANPEERAELLDELTRQGVISQIGKHQKEQSSSVDTTEPDSEGVVVKVGIMSGGNEISTDTAEALIDELQSSEPAEGQQSSEAEPVTPANEVSEEKANTPKFIDQMIAHFIYNFETYPYSACNKRSDQRSLIIDENMVFLAERDDSDLGYKFTVEACSPRIGSTQ